MFFRHFRTILPQLYPKVYAFLNLYAYVLMSIKSICINKYIYDLGNGVGKFSYFVTGLPPCNLRSKADLPAKIPSQFGKCYP